MSANSVINLPIEHADVTKTLELIGESELTVITAHQNPDGDAVGSALGLYHILKFAGRNCICILPDPSPSFLHWMKGYDSIIFFNQEKEKATELLSKSDLIFCLDYNAADRTGKEMAPVLVATKAKKIMIDHHPHPDGFCTMTFNYPADCSTAQLIYRFIVTLGYDNHIGKDAAECLYAGIMTDTGSFRYPSTTALTHRIIADLIDKGASNSSIHNRIFDSNTESRLKLTGYALSQKMVVMPEHKTAYITLTAEELDQFNYQSGDTEGLVNYGLSIQGIMFAAIFMEKDGLIKISFRSKGEVPVNAFMQTNFSGGGHKNAAGGRSNQSMDVTLQRFLSLIPEFMKNY